MKRLIMILAVAVLTGCCAKKKADVADASSAEKPSTEMKASSFEILKQESYGGREAESHQVITSQQQLAALYNELNLQGVPTVNFDNKQLVALFMGEKTSGGYSINVESVTVDADTATVTVKKTKPDGIATMALTQPYCIVAIAKTKTVVVK